MRSSSTPTTTTSSSGPSAGPRRRGRPAGGRLCGRRTGDGARDRLRGNERRGLTARCRREDGSEYHGRRVRSRLPGRLDEDRYVAAYRTWLGIEPYPERPLRRKPKATEDDLDHGQECRPRRPCRQGKRRLLPHPRERACPHPPAQPASGRECRARSSPSHRAGRGATGATPTSRARSTHGASTCAALGLTPLALKEQGMWDPREHYWGEPDEPIEPWARPIIKQGPRPDYEMEQVLPGEDPDDPDTDPILDAVELKRGGRPQKARPRAHEPPCRGSPLPRRPRPPGELRVPPRPRHGRPPLRHGGEDRGALPRQGLRRSPSLGVDRATAPSSGVSTATASACGASAGLREAEKVFTRMLWLNPADNQGVRSELSKT